MFVLQETRTYDWPVVVKMPVDGGKFESRRFTATFRLLTRDQADDLTQDPARDQDTDFLMDVVVGLKGVNDEDGNEIPFDADLLKKMIGIAYVRTAMIEAYFNSITGDAARRKN